MFEPSFLWRNFIIFLCIIDSSTLTRFYTFLIGFAGFGLAYFLFFILLGKNVFGIHNQFIQRI